MKFLKIFLALMLFIILVGGSLTAFAVYRFIQPADAENTTKVAFTIPKGQSVSKIGDRLAEVGLIRHPLVFRAYVKKLNATNKIQAGTFQLSPSMTPEQLIQGMTQGTDDLSVTLLEGWRREEMAESFAKYDLPNFDKEEFLELTEDKEGYLFPDTYLLQREFDTEQIVSLLENTFERKVSKGLAKEITASGKPLKEIITMASLIQREAKGETQMKQVSSVLWKRIDVDMGLNVDATLQYIRGYDDIEKSWWSPPLVAQKESTSPYNTYKFVGLPPGPVSNPGLEAIEAALQPAETQYLYYLHDTKGAIHFGKTLDEHNANVQKYLR